MTIARKIEAYVPGPRRRPFAFLPPDVGPHDEDLDRRLRYQWRLDPFQPVIEPLQLEAADRQAALRPETHVLERNRHIVRPGSDQNAVESAVFMQRFEGIQIALGIVVV